MIKKLLFSSIIFISFQSAFARTYYFGLELQTTTDLAPKSFTDVADYGRGFGALLGYHFSDKWAVELGYDQFNFGGLDMVHENLGLAGVYRPWSDRVVNPFARLGVGLGENNFEASGMNRQRGLAAHVGGGFEFNFKPASLYAGVSWNYLDKVTNDIKGAQSINFNFGVIFPGLGLGDEVKKEVAPVISTPAPVIADEKKVDKEDFVSKCLNSESPECIAPGSASVKVNVEFLPGKSEIRPEYSEEVERLAKYMQKYPKTKVQIAGHTDNTGSEKMNTRISQNRADSVRNVLVQKYSIDAKRISAKGYGPTKPLESNSSAEGRAKNRRVEANITIQ